MTTKVEEFTKLDRCKTFNLLTFKLSRVGIGPRPCSGRTFLYDYVVIFLDLAGDESFGFSFDNEVLF